MCSSLTDRDENSFRLKVQLQTEMCRSAIRLQRKALSPQQQVDEHSDGEEGASHGGVAAQEEEEVAEEAEEDHPDHMELEEQVEGVEASRYGAQVFQHSGDT